LPFDPRRLASEVTNLVVYPRRALDFTGQTGTIV
jgi:hypothetical protein